MNNMDVSRRRFIVSTAFISGGSILGSASALDRGITPAQSEGPFYPTTEQSDKDNDLTTIEGGDAVAIGEVVIIEGRILERDGSPIANAIVDIWQANAAGRYAHEADPNPAPLDPNFQGWAVLKTNADGRYKFKTIRPGAYPVDAEWSRPPHIHFKVSRRGFKEITTQMYFAGEKLNDVDKLLNSVPVGARSSLIAIKDEVSGLYQFDVTLEKV